MKVHRLVIAVIDFDGLGADGVKQEVESVRYPNRCIAPKVVSVETADIGEWEESNPLNFRDKHDAEFARLFPAARVPATRAQRSLSTSWGSEVAYDQGWNDCCAAMLSAAPAPEALRDWSERMAAVETGQHVSAGSHGIADEPAPEADGEVYELQTGERRVQLAKHARDLPVGTKLYTHPAPPPPAGQPERDALSRMLQFADELDRRDARAAMAAWKREYAELMARKPKGADGQPEGVEALVAKWRDDAKFHDTYGRVICASMCEGHALELEIRLASAPQSAGSEQQGDCARGGP